MKFRTAYCDKEYFPSPTGTRFRTKYTRSFNNDGVAILEKSGVEDVYDSIQKAANGNTISDLIRRAKAGDPDAIKAPIDSYVNLSGCPRDLLEAHKMLLDARGKFDTLPTDLRNKFGNSFEQFLAASGSGAAVVELGKLAKAQKSTTQPLSAAEIEALRKTIGGTPNA